MPEENDPPTVLPTSVDAVSCVENATVFVLILKNLNVLDGGA